MLTDDRRIRVLNRDWRSKDKATDVLSFPQQGIERLHELRAGARLNATDSWELGDVVISLERAQAQALEKGHSLRRELDILLVHGILHLLGFDHELSENDAKKMRRWELRLLR